MGTTELGASRGGVSQGVSRIQPAERGAKRRFRPRGSGARGGCIGPIVLVASVLALTFLGSRCLRPAAMLDRLVTGGHSEWALIGAVEQAMHRGLSTAVEFAATSALRTPSFLLGTAEAATPARSQKVVRVGMSRMNFGPGELTVRAGTTVEWVNGDVVPHTVTAKDHAWDSGLIQPGKRFQRRFDRPGRYPYVCQVHPGMSGVVVVR